MNAQLIESQVTVQFKIACLLIGHDAANVLFDSFGLNDDNTWEGKAEEAEALVDALICADTVDYNDHVDTMESVRP